MRSIWKGHIRFALVAIPVRLYNAIETSETIHLNQLHKTDHGPIGYDKRCKKCGQVATKDEIVKGYQFAPDQYAIIEPEDIAKVKVKTTKVIDIVGFVDAPEIPPLYYDSPYFLGPDGIVASKPYGLVREVLRESGKIGVGKVVLRDREDFVAIAPFGEGLVIYKLHYPAEIRKITDVPQLDTTQQSSYDANELKLTRTLIEHMATSVSEVDMRDRYNEGLKEVIESKIAGKEISTFVEEEQPTVDIMTALMESIKQVERKPMVKARGKTEAASKAEEKTEEKAEAKPRKRKAS